MNELFQLKEDMENYVKYSLTGKPMKIKKGVFPHFFDCQKHRSNKETPTLTETLLDIILLKY